MARVQNALQDAELDAVICALPSNVLLLAGYWPVVGKSLAICVRGGPTTLLVPEDEHDLAEKGFADVIETFEPGTLRTLPNILDAIQPLLAAVLSKVRVASGSIGVETGGHYQASSYLGMYLFGSELPSVVQELLPSAVLVSIDQWIAEQACVKTSEELVQIRQACAIAKKAYESASKQCRAGMKETEVAQLFRSPLSTTEVPGPSIQRCDGFAFCMSGPNSAKAGAAYARSRQRKLESSDLVMVHCNSYVDGFWTDITRTFTLQARDRRQTKMFEAVFAARAAGLSIIKPGTEARAVDAEVRRVIEEHGMGDFLKHGTGHGVGFSPSSARKTPEIHAESGDILKEGIVFNVEPAVYIEGYGGARHCDMVAVTGTGYELLTDFLCEPQELVIGGEGGMHQRKIASGIDGRTLVACEKHSQSGQLNRNWRRQ
ncbi:MAG: M24 family metallopeptidase [Candidatus Acidiferrum sp.]